LAKAISDPKIAAGLIEAAADLKDKAGELPPINIEAITRLRRPTKASFRGCWSGNFW
jgi:hypothetical protein